MGGILIYIVMFVLSVSLFEIYERNDSRKLQIVALIVAILLPCILAGLRDITVGTDTSGYAHNLYLTASNSANLKEYYGSTFYNAYDRYVIDYDFGYTVLTYISAHVFKSFGSLLFLTEAMIIVPIVIGLIKLKKHYCISISLSMLMFYFLFYNMTLNVMRQFISLSFGFLAVCHLLTDKNYFLIILLVFIGYSFHGSGLLVFAVCAMYFLADVISKGRLKSLKKENAYVSILLMLAILFICLYSIKPIAIPILEHIGLRQFGVYLDGDISFSINQLIYQLIFIIVIFIEYNKTLTIDSKTDLKTSRFVLLLLFSFVIYCVSCQLATINENSWRISLFFEIYVIILFSYLYSTEENKRKKNIILLILLLYLILFWAYTFVFTGRHGTIPFVFSLKL